MSRLNFAVIIPTYNAGKYFKLFLSALNKQQLQKHQVLFIDSSSTDGTTQYIKETGYPFISIEKHEFNHGGTRQLGIEYFKQAEIVVFLTQDAILENKKSIKNILAPFSTENNIAAVCGRQIPHANATPLACHARYFNYPSQSFVRSKSDIDTFGIKCAFMSNSFSAYDIKKLNSIGGFPDNTILCEDMYATAKMILAGYNIAYAGGAIVKHSHNYSCSQEFKRYFDIGAFHADEPWIQNELGNAAGEGLKFIKSELTYLKKNQSMRFLYSFILNTTGKILGYKLGKKHQYIHQVLKKKISMHPSYWNKKLDL